MRLIKRVFGLCLIASAILLALLSSSVWTAGDKTSAVLIGVAAGAGIVVGKGALRRSRSSSHGKLASERENDDADAL
jgi:hypothetical protein